jgi:hypothetical protein
LKVELPYLAVLRLTCIAVTPIVLVQTILSYASVNVPGLSLLSLAAALGYLYFAVKANSEIEPAPA